MNREAVTARTVRVDRAVFGERNRGHALLAHTGLSHELQAELPSRTDVPAGAPPGIEWEPFISGYPVRDAYVLSRTFPDPGASRPGMVLTHALVMPLADIGDVVDLSDCLALLPTYLGERSDLSPASLAIQSADTSGSNRGGALVPGELALARALLTVRDESVVWIGPPSFEAALVALWGNLWPEVRRGLSFRLSFGPADAGAGGPTIATAPAATAARWPKTRAVSAYSDEPPLIAAEAVLVGDASGRPLLGFLRRSGARLTKIRDLKLVESAFQYAATNDGLFDSAGALVRLLAVLSPATGSGSDIKRGAVGRLAERIRAARAEEVGSIRNLNLAPFSGAEDVLRGAIEEWTAGSLESPGALPQAVIQVISDALAGEGPDWWTHGVVSAVRRLSQRGIESRFEVTWAVAVARPEQGLQWLNELPADDVTENRLIAACPSTLPPEVSKRAAQLAVKKNWEQLHAELALRAFEPEVAIQQHFAAFDRPSKQSIEALVRRVSPKAVLETALTGIDALVPYAGKEVAADLRLASAITPSDPRGRRIWMAAIDEGAPAHLGLASPDALIADLLAALRAGQSVEPRLLVAVARAGTGNLHISKDRREAWLLVPHPARENFLASTADAWLAEVLAASRALGAVAPFENSVEPELQRAIVARQRMGLLAKEGGVAIDLALALFGAFLGTSEDVVDDWTEKVTARRVASSAQALALASLIRDRAWRRVAGTLFRAAESAPEYRAAAHTVRFLVSRWDRLKTLLWGHDAPTSSVDDAWETLVDLATDLYAWGPGERDIWQRAGGDFARLEMGKTGEDSWRKAISTIRKGGGGNVSAESLLRAMQEGFANNKQVELLLKNIHWFRFD